MTDRCARCKSDTREASVILVCGGPALCAVCAMEEVLVGDSATPSSFPASNEATKQAAS